MTVTTHLLDGTRQGYKVICAMLAMCLERPVLSSLQIKLWKYLATI